MKNVLPHLARTVAFDFAGRVARILSADEPQLKATGSAEPACRLNLEHMLAEFRRQRARSIELVARLAPWDLDRAGIHERVGRLTVNDLLHEWVHHDRAHLKQILANVQAYVFPRMGGAQAFVAYSGRANGPEH